MDEGKNHLKEIRKGIWTRDYPSAMNHKQIERIIGHLNHVAIAYEIIIPFIRGFHNKIDIWRDNSDVEGSKDLEE